jgi:hypothetical protein
MESLKNQPIIAECLTDFIKSVAGELDVSPSNWFGIADELKCVVKFFLLQPEYKEPFKMQSRHSAT